jgi:hypothetical protein
MVILAGSGTNADVAEESVMHPIIEAGIMKTRTRPRRTAERTRLVWRGPDPGQACRQGTARPAGGLAVQDRQQQAPGLGWPVTGRCRYQPGRAASRRLRTFRPAISAVTAMARIRAGNPHRAERAVAGLVLTDTSRRLG